MPVQSMAHGILRLWSMTMRFSWSQTRASWAQAEWARKMFGEEIAMAGLSSNILPSLIAHPSRDSSNTTPIVLSKHQRTQKMDKHDNMEQLQKFPTQPIFAYPRSLLPTICWIMSRFSEAAQSACRGRESGSLPLDPREGVEWEYSP